MSIKKTWFSYILWLIATGFSVLLTYNVVSLEVFSGEAFPFQIGYGAAFLLLTVALCLLIRKIRDKIALPVVSKWTGRVFHILFFLGITAVFIGLRIWKLRMEGMASVLHREQAQCFFELSKIGANAADIEKLQNTFYSISLVPSAFENIYIKVLSGLFLFLGNKAEVMIYFQLILQALSYICLILIGWNMYRGMYAWLPALMYAVSPVIVSETGDTGPANFWLCIVVLGIFLICLFEKFWKHRLVTYIVTAVWGIVCCVLVLAAKIDLIFYNGTAFLSGAYLSANRTASYIEFVVLTVLMIFYCVSFWFSKTEHGLLYILPIALCVGLMIPMMYREADVIGFLLAFMMIWMYLLETEGLRLVLTAKPKVLTGKNIPVKEAEKMVVPTAELQDEILVNSETIEEPVVIRVSDILKGSTQPEEEKVLEEHTVIDKTAMIENVLPMPKKHVNRTFEYSFEPSKDMMHYDVEVENDDYDYQ